MNPLIKPFLHILLSFVFITSHTNDNILFKLSYVVTQCTVMHKSFSHIADVSFYKFLHCTIATSHNSPSLFLVDNSVFLLPLCVTVFITFPPLIYLTTFGHSVIFFYSIISLVLVCKCVCFSLSAFFLLCGCCWCVYI